MGVSVDLAATVERSGTEYSVLGRQIGDQFFPKMSVGENGGYLVWQDNNIDGDGLGIHATRLNANLNSVMGTFQVNEITEGNQQRPVVAVLTGGETAIAWESEGDIQFRMLNQDGVFLGGEQKANSYVNGIQQDPAVTALNNGHFVLVWGSHGQDGDMQGVFGQIFDGAGEPVGAEFSVNQSLRYNQRTPSVAALSNGRFIVTWVNEQLAQPDPNSVVAGVERFEVNVNGRIYTSEGVPLSDELVLGDSTMIHANPAVVGVDGGFVIVNSGRAQIERAIGGGALDSSWDIFAQSFDQLGRPTGDRFQVNSHSYGDQVVPSLTRVRDRTLVAWTSLGQDGDNEGVFGRVLTARMQADTDEFQINSQSRNKQMLPAVASTERGDAVVVWANYTGGRDSYDLRAQKFSIGEESGTTELPAPAAPFVFGTGYWSLGVSWPAPEGLEVANYEVYLDGAESPTVVGGNSHAIQGLSTDSSHSVAIAYVLADGSRSGVSEVAVGSTWSRDENFDGLPDEYQSEYWGPNSINWPGSNEDGDGDGATNLEELLAGTDPTDASSLLETQIVSSGPGIRLEWNTQPGGFYQVQVSTDISNWFDASSPRLAVGDFDSIAIENDLGVAVYRVIRLK